MNFSALTARALPLFWLCFLFGATPPPAVRAGEEPLPAEDETASLEAEQEESPDAVVHLGSLFFGYRWVSQNEDARAAEYQSSDSSLTLGIDTEAYPLPHRYHLHAEYLNAEDFYADVGYAYKDLLLFRDILVGIHHNLDHYTYQDAGEPPALNYEERSPGSNYFTDFASNLFSLRLKTPDFPFHTFLKHRHVQRDGDIQQRFLLGSFGNLTKTSETRAIDWQADTVTLGANSHLGPLELEYQYDYSEFDPGGNNILYDFYPATAFRPADIFPHHVNPETEAYANSLKMHTSYAGGIVASATLSNLEQKNNYSNTEAGAWKGAFDFRWLPEPVIGLFFKYRHKELDLDQADLVQLAGAANVLSYPVRQGVSYGKDQFSFSARYKPWARLTLLPSYEFSLIDRKDVDEWQVLPETTRVHTLNLTAQGRLLDTLKVKGQYEYKSFDDPAYNIEPDASSRVRLNATYTPLPWLTGFLEYVLTETDRDDLRYPSTLPQFLLEGSERDGRSDRLSASLSCAVSEKVTLTGSWTYSRWQVEQDLAFASRSSSDRLPFIDFGSSYSDQANTFSLSLQYLPREDLTITSEVIHTLASGEYVPDTATVSPNLPAVFPAMHASETFFSVEVAKKMPKNWELGLRFYTDTYDDRSGETLDGELIVTTFTLKRYF